MYQFHGCHWHGNTCLKNCAKRQQRRCKDTCQIDRLIKNNGWDTKYNLNVNLPILKQVRFKKEFTRYPHFIVYGFEAILAPLNEHPTDDLTYSSSHVPISVAVHDTLSEEREEEPVYLVDQSPQRLVERFIEFLTEKQEAIAADDLKEHPNHSDF